MWRQKLEKHPKLWLGLTLLWMVILYILSTPYFSSQNLPEKINDFRFVAHLVVYFILGFLASGSIRLNFTWKHKFLFTLLFCILFCLSDEFHQHLAPGRRFRFIDLSLDALGSLAGILTYYCVHLRLRKRNA